MTGRKPVPASMIDPAERKRSNAEIENRQAIENSLLVTAKLTCPKTLSAYGKIEWRRVVKLYKQMGSNILSDLDITALTMYCESAAIYKKAQETWAKYQMLVGANAGTQRILDKSIKTMNEQTKIVNKLSEQLCLTPVGRARMGMMKVVDDGPSELDDILDD